VSKELQNSSKTFTEKNKRFGAKGGSVMEEFSFLKNVRLLSTPQRFLIKCGNKKKVSKVCSDAD